MTFVGPKISPVYRDMCKCLLNFGKSVTARDLWTTELLNVQVQLYDPRQRFVNFKARNMDMRYFVGELCHYLDGRTDLASIAHYSKFWERVSDDGKTINSAYGFRLFRYGMNTSQFDYALWCLRADPSSRKAVMTIYHPSDARESKDNPCTLSLQLIMRDDELHMFTSMRSQDVWLGVPYDFAFFTIVQEIALVMLQYTYPKLKLGTYFHNVTSLHAYMSNIKLIKALVLEGDHNAIVAPSIIHTDVDAWFNDLLTYEKAKRGVVLYKNESLRTSFQDWCKSYL